MQPIFDAGIFAIMLIIGFSCMAFTKKFGALMLVVPIVCFLISGLVIVTGDDVAFFKLSSPTNQTTTYSFPNGTVTSITKISVSPANETDYLVGNGQFPIVGTGQLILGYSLILLSLMIGVIFLDQTLKGNLIKGD